MGESEDRVPLILPLGDAGVLVRFGTTLNNAANRRAVRFARQLREELPAGVTEIDPNLVSVLLKYDPALVEFDRLAGEVRLRLSAELEPDGVGSAKTEHRIEVTFGGSDGPDFDEAAAALGLDGPAFIAAHDALPLRVLTTGFAPGFVYCGFHPEAMRLPRRTSVRQGVSAGSVLFAAGQTAITSTTIPTGWHVIGRTSFRNFEPGADPPTVLREGDLVSFTMAPQ
jgi:KipI family sensor histidine kinase inhibitor